MQYFFRLCLGKAVMKMTVGLLICGDSLDYDHCKYKFPKYKISFHYTDNSQNVSVFDRITDPDKSKSSGVLHLQFNYINFKNIIFRTVITAVYA